MLKKILAMIYEKKSSLISYFLMLLLASNASIAMDIIESEIQSLNDENDIKSRTESIVTQAGLDKIGRCRDNAILAYNELNRRRNRPITPYARFFIYSAAIGCATGMVFYMVSGDFVTPFLNPSLSLGFIISGGGIINDKMNQRTVEQLKIKKGVLEALHSLALSLLNNKNIAEVIDKKDIIIDNRLDDIINEIKNTLLERYNFKIEENKTMSLLEKAAVLLLINLFFHDDVIEKVSTFDAGTISQFVFDHEYLKDAFERENY